MLRCIGLSPLPLTSRGHCARDKQGSHRDPGVNNPLPERWPAGRSGGWIQSPGWMSLIQCRGWSSWWLPHAQCYINRKVFPSIQLQAICDHRGRFLDIFVGFSDSVHDARVLKNSPVYVRQLYPPEGKCILGDGGYPCLAAPMRLVTSYREPEQNPA